MRNNVLSIEEALELISPIAKARQRKYMKEYGKKYYSRPENKARQKDYYRLRYLKNKQKGVKRE